MNLVKNLEDNMLISESILTVENVLLKMDNDLTLWHNMPCTLSILMTLSFYMEFAISTGELRLIQCIHDKIDKYYFEHFS